MSVPACVVCSKPLVEGGEYCPFCGAEAISSSSGAVIDAYLRKKVDLELSGRLKDQNSLVREIADKAEDILWSRFKRYSVIVGLLMTVIIGVVAFLGVKSLSDLSARIEPIIHDAEERAKAAKQTIEITAARVDTVKASLDQLSRDVEVETTRIAQTSGEISQKLGSLETVANDAQKNGEAYQQRAEELSSKLESMEKSLETRVQTISKQVDRVSIQKAYPTLGQQKFVTLNGNWKDKTDKGPNEKWINVYIQPTSYGEILPEQLESLLKELKTRGCTPLLGIFGTGGPYSTGFGPLGDYGTGTTIFYFNNEAKQMADEVRSLASSILTLKIDDAPIFVDRSKFAPSDDRQFVIDNSGLDIQLYIRR